MIDVYGYWPSGNCWKVRQALDLTGNSYRWVETDSNAGATQTAGFLALNPNGKVPIVVMADGTVITESNAILCHFAEGTGLMPPPGLARTRVFEWLFFEQYSHEPYIAVARNVIAYQKAKAANMDRLPAIWEKGHRALAVMERRLGQADWLAGETMTVADIALYAYTHVADEGEFDLSGYPGVMRWIERFGATPGVVGLRKKV
ncbi:MAG: glutathione S-transferase family protein [Hyphomicrobiaceae bacterium]